VNFPTKNIKLNDNDKILPINGHPGNTGENLGRRELLNLIKKKQRYYLRYLDVMKFSEIVKNIYLQSAI
jgi:hypothetical protein